MKPIKRAFGLLFLILNGLWLLANTLIPEPFSSFSFRTVFVQYAGIIRNCLPCGKSGETKIKDIVYTL